MEHLSDLAVADELPVDEGGIVHREHSHMEMRNILEGFFVSNLLLSEYSPYLVQGRDLGLLILEIRDCDSHIHLVCLLPHSTLTPALSLCK